MRRRGGQPEVFVVTDAGRSLREDRDIRTRNYLIKMGIRTVALIVAIVLWSVGVPWPWLLALIVLSTVLPFFSVISANTVTPHPATPPATRFTPDPPRALRPGRDDRRDS